jgi:hypothetical protein
MLRIMNNTLYLAEYRRVGGTKRQPKYDRQ